MKLCKWQPGLVTWCCLWVSSPPMPVSCTTIFSRSVSPSSTLVGYDQSFFHWQNGLFWLFVMLCPCIIGFCDAQWSSRTNRPGQSQLRYSCAQGHEPYRQGNWPWHAGRAFSITVNLKRSSVYPPQQKEGFHFSFLTPCL